MLLGLLSGCLLGVAGAAQATDWPQFRGPDANGVAPDGPPSIWNETENVAWVIDVPGSGWSAPIVTDGRVLLTTAVPERGDVYRFELHCYDLATGGLVWKRVVMESRARVGTHRDNTYASETPITDGEHVYAYFGMHGLFCYDLDGELVWKRDLGVYPMRNDWGTASSLAMHRGPNGGRLFVQIDNEQDSHALAISPQDGAELWRVERPGEVSTWSSPIVWRNSQRAELILGGQTVRSHDPATGRELWSMEIGGRSSASPAAVGDVLYIGSENRSRRGGTPGGLFAVEAGAEGAIDVTLDPADQPGLLWADLRGAIGMASPLVYDNRLYVLERRGGLMRVHDATDGSLLYRQRLPGVGAFWSSPWACNDRVYCLGDSGKTCVLEPSDEYRLIGENTLPGRFWSTPAVADDSLLLRGERRLWCVRATRIGG